MNLQQLESALPKPWLNIQCNRLTANEVVTPVVPAPITVFASSQNGAVSNVNNAPTSNIMTTTTISNPNFNPATNVYTASVAQYVSFSLSYVFTCSALAQNITTSVFFRLNGVLRAVGSVVRVSASISDNYTVNLNEVIQLAAGDTVGYLITATSTQVGSQLAFGQFSGVVV